MLDGNLLRFSSWRLSVHDCESEADTMAAMARNVWGGEMGAGTERGFGVSVGGQEGEGLQDAM